MIGAVIAMQSEANILLEEMQIAKTTTLYGKTIYEGKVYGKDVVLCLCGVGKVNAGVGAQILLSDYHVHTLINFGVAGGLNNTTQLCNVYQIEAAVQFDFDLVQLNGTKIGTLNEYTENYLSVQTLPLDFEKRKLGSADRFNDSPIDFKLLTEELNADIRDMEGGAIAQVALSAKIPFYSVKAISDVAGQGSTTEQFLQNTNKALQNLKSRLYTIFEVL